MAIICPTVTPTNAHHFREQMERVTGFAKRVHIDFMDGKFAPIISPRIDQAWWPEHTLADLHIMYEKPDQEVEKIVKLKPHLAIVHAEAKGNFVSFAQAMHEADIKAGVAILPKTSVELIKPALEHVDHILVFSGDLGYFGGQVNVRLLDKVAQIKQLKPTVEVGWDGGVNDTNVHLLVAAGVDVLNVGGYIQRAEKPKERFETLQNLLH